MVYMALSQIKLQLELIKENVCNVCMRMLFEQWQEITRNCKYTIVVHVLSTSAESAPLSLTSDSDAIMKTGIYQIEVTFGP